MPCFLFLFFNERYSLLSFGGPQLYDLEALPAAILYSAKSRQDRCLAGLTSCSSPDVDLVAWGWACNCTTNLHLGLCNWSTTCATAPAAMFYSAKSRQDRCLAGLTSRDSPDVALVAWSWACNRTTNLHLGPCNWSTTLVMHRDYIHSPTTYHHRT